MPHRRNYDSRRKFRDGVYRYLSSHHTLELCESQLRRYEKVSGKKLRHIKGEDHKYHIYEKVSE